MTDARFIHITTNDPISSFLCLSNIPLYTYSISPLSTHLLMDIWLFLCPGYCKQCCNEYRKWSEVTQSCPTLCDPMHCSLPGSLVHGIFQARVLEWVAISFSRGSSQPRERTRVSQTASRHVTVWATREAPAMRGAGGGVSQMSQLLASGGQNIGVSSSTSVLPKNTQDWYPFRWTGWISLQSKGLSTVFSNTTVQNHQFFGTQLSL